MNTPGKTAAELRAMAEALEWAETHLRSQKDYRCNQEADAIKEERCNIAMLAVNHELRAAAETAEKAQGEPVAWMDPDDPDEGTAFTKEEWPRHKVALYTHPDPRVAVLEAALVVLIRETQAVADDCHTPRYARLDEALTSARAALGEGS